MTFMTRLEAALSDAGKTKADLARHLGIATQAISQWKRGGLPNSGRWADIAAYVGQPIEVLFGNAFPDHRAVGQYEVVAARGAPKSNLVHINEYDISPHAGPGAALSGMSQEGDQPGVIDQWAIPRRVADAFVEHTNDLAVIRIAGDSMEPDYLAGDRVMIDMGHRIPSPPGVYVLWDGMGIVLKRLEVVFGSSDPVIVRISSINPAYATYERPLDEVHINGRVVGKWVWK